MLLVGALLRKTCTVALGAASDRDAVWETLLVDTDMLSDCAEPLLLPELELELLLEPPPELPLLPPPPPPQAVTDKMDANAKTTRPVLPTNMTKVPLFP